jgi:hypothetical protein
MVVIVILSEAKNLSVTTRFFASLPCGPVLSSAGFAGRAERTEAAAQGQDLLFQAISSPVTTSR